MNEWTAQLPWHEAFYAALRWAGAVSGLGWAWNWTLSHGDEETRGSDRVVTLANLVAVGLVLLLGSGLVLASFSRFCSPWTHGSWWALVWLGVLANPHHARQTWRDLFTATAILTAVTAVGLWWPNRSEWILGGWDPGLYLNEGIRIACEGGWSSRPDPLFSALTADELAVFTRPIHGYLEALPGVSVSPQTRALDILFFRLTPTWIGWLHHCGGLPLALRMGWVGSGCAAFIWAGAARRMLRCETAAWVAIAILVTHSLFVYHLSLPVSEIPSLALLGSLMLFDATPPRAAVYGWKTATLFLCVANRVSFLPFGALWLHLSAMADTTVRPRLPVHRKRFLQFLALVGGAWFDRWTNLVTIERLGDSTGRLLLVFVAFTLTAIVWDLSATVAPSTMQRALSAIHAVGRRMAHPLVAGLWVGVWAVVVYRLGPSPNWNARVLIYLGPISLALSLVGWAWSARKEFGLADPLWRWASWGAIASCIAWIRPEIMRWWPWASRRFVEFGLPWMALGAALLVRELGRWWPLGSSKTAKPVRAWALATVAVLCIVQLPRAIRAWQAVDFSGATAKLGPLLNRPTDRTVWVVDHFRWATPLKFLGGHAVVNGELFLSGEDRADRFRLALHTLQRLSQEGWTVHFLTTTRKGMDVFPSSVSGLREEYDSGEFELTEVVHHPAARSFSTRVRTFRLRGFTWRPSSDCPLSTPSESPSPP